MEKHFVSSERAFLTCLSTYPPPLFLLRPAVPRPAHVYALVITIQIDMDGSVKYFTLLYNMREELTPSLVMQQRV